MKRYLLFHHGSHERVHARNRESTSRVHDEYLCSAARKRYMLRNESKLERYIALKKGTRL